MYRALLILGLISAFLPSFSIAGDIPNIHDDDARRMIREMNDLGIRTLEREVGTIRIFSTQACDVQCERDTCRMVPNCRGKAVVIENAKDFIRTLVDFDVPTPIRLDEINCKETHSRGLVGIQFGPGCSFIEPGSQ